MKSAKQNGLNKDRLSILIIFVIFIIFISLIYTVDNAITKSVSNINPIVKKVKDLSEIVLIPPITSLWKGPSGVDSTIVVLSWSINSDIPVDVYWVNSFDSCNLAVNMLGFNYYPSCSSEKIYSASKEYCKVPFSSGICIVNRNEKPAKVSISITQST